jgi:serine/threonine protein kinase
MHKLVKDPEEMST